MAADQRKQKQSSQIDVSVTLTVVPFGQYTFHETVVTPQEPIAQSSDFAYPEGTAVFKVVPSPEPLVVITH